MANRIKVMLVDDHAVVREGYKILLKEVEEIDIVAEAENGERAVFLYNQYNPDVIVMDISLPGISGIDTVKRLISINPDVKVLVFSMHEEIIFVEQALQAGAFGYVTKSSDPQLLSKAIIKVSRGEKYIDDDLRHRMAYEKKADSGTALSDLSSREFEVFCLLAEGLNTTKISQKLKISYKTSANYSTQIKNKLNARTVADLARIAIRNNIIKA